MKVLARYLSIVVLLGSGLSAYSSSVPINLGTSGNFGVLAGSGITNVSSATSITGDVGSAPTPAVTGLLATQVNGTLYLSPSPITTQAQVDLTTAYLQAQGAPCGTILTGQDLGGLTLVPGVYCFSSSAQLTGTLTLDGQGDPTAQWIFQMGSTLTTASNSVVSLINSGSKCNVFWQVGSSATIGTGSVFVGNILALTSITLDGGTLNGRALASNGAVTISAQETIDNSGCGNCTTFVTSPANGTVTKISFPMPFDPLQTTQTVIASGLTSAGTLTCGGTNKLLYVAQDGLTGGPLQIMKMAQSGQNQKNVVTFSNVSGLSQSGGPTAPTLQPGTGTLFFNTTASNGFSNTGAWSMKTATPAQVLAPFVSDGGGATAFLTKGVFSGNLLVVDVANKKVVRVKPPFTASQSGVDFITTNLTGPVGLAVNAQGNVFVSNTDGTIQQFNSAGKFVGQYAATGLNNTNIAFSSGANLMVATSQGSIIWVHSDGTLTTVGTIAGAQGITTCPK